MEVAPAVFAGLKSARAVKRELCLGRRRQVRRAADEPWMMLGNRVEDLAGGLAAGQSLGVRREYRQFAAPPFGGLAMLHLRQVGGGGRLGHLILLEQFRPGVAKSAAARADAR